MTNQVFEDARAMLSRNLAAIESAIGGEIDRVQSLGLVAQQTQQHVEALKRNESDLMTIVNGLAQKVAAAKQSIEDAETSSRAIVARARTLAGTIETEARAKSEELRAAAKRDAEIALSAAHSEIEVIQGKVAAAKEQLTEIQRQHRDEHNRLSVIKRAAADFAKA